MYPGLCPGTGAETDGDVESKHCESTADDEFLGLTQAAGRSKESMSSARVTGRTTRYDL